MDEIGIFVNRLKKIGIEVKLCMNFPWVYLIEVNGQKVKEKYWSDYAFTIVMLPIREGQKFKFHNIELMFKTIRKYANRQ